MESGKHQALKQSDDGSFELVVEDDPVEEPKAEATPPPKASPTQTTEPPGGMVKWFVLAAVIAIVGVVGAFVVVSVGSEREADEDESTFGFKPYTGDEGEGGQESASAAIRPVETVRPTQPARRVVDDSDEPEIVESDVEMVEESDPQWELDENGNEIVESEEVPPDFLDQVEQTEGEIEPERDGTKLANPKVIKNIRDQINRDIEIRKSLPDIKLNARPRQLNPRLRPGNATGPTSIDEITVIEDGNFEESEVEEELE